jgi:hypothetical protein
LGDVVSTGYLTLNEMRGQLCTVKLKKKKLELVVVILGTVTASDSAGGGKS